MPVYTLNPSHRRGARKASRSTSLRERIAVRRNSAQSADGSETYYPTSSSSSSSSSSSTQRSRAATSAATAVANAQARRHAAEASGYMGNPRAKTPTGMYVLALVNKGTDYAVKDATRADIKSGFAMTYEDALELGRERVAELRAQGFVNKLFDMSTYHEMKKHNPLSEDGMTVSNPKRPSYKMVGVVKPRSRSGGTAQKAGLAKGQSLMARAAAAYRAGEYASMQDALRGVAHGGASRGGRKHNPLSEDGAVVSNPRPSDFAISIGGKTVYTPDKKSLIGAAVAWSKGSDAQGKYEDVILNDGLRLVVRRTKGGATYDIAGRGRGSSGGTAGNVAQAKALSLHYALEMPRKSNPTMPVQLVAPTLPKKISRRMPRQHTVANPHYAEETDEDEYEVQAEENKMLRQELGQNVGLNADWADDAYYIAPRGGKANRTSGAIYLNNLDGGDWSLVQVTYDEEEGSSEYAPLKTFGSAREAVNYISSHRAELERKATEMRANPRRKGSKGKAKRSGGRTAAQSNAARAMKLFHSGQASSLGEAWDIIRSGR